MNKNTMKKRGGFTLIELLIVVGLLGALAAIVLPRLGADREDALEYVDNFNAGGTLRTLSMFHQLFAVYPTVFHTGLTDIDATTLATDTDSDKIRDTDGTYTMEGMPKGMSMVSTKVTSSILALTEDEVSSLTDAGIDILAYSDGLNTNATAEGVAVLKVTSDNASYWKTGYPSTATTFNGVSLSDYCDPDEDGTDEYSLIVLYVTPTMDWTGPTGGNDDWSNGSVDLDMDMPAQSPLPIRTADEDVDVSFSYYAAWFLVDLSGEEPATLISVTRTGGDSLFNS
jgi:prepilin-type N-terminal cleavage/methylation domain-containing protein